VFTHRSEAEAVAIANETDYGLAAFINSTDVQKTQSLARRVDAVWFLINNAIAGVSGSMTLPIGGVKQSGIGRSSGAWGLAE
jgi:aldehyde dehydrogenase (NAD+)